MNKRLPVAWVNLGLIPEAEDRGFCQAGHHLEMAESAACLFRFGIRIRAFASSNYFGYSSTAPVNG